MIPKIGGELLFLFSWFPRTGRELPPAGFAGRDGFGQEISCLGSAGTIQNSRREYSRTDSRQETARITAPRLKITSLTERICSEA